MARLYSNENLPFPAVLAIRERGHDVLTSLEAGNANLQVPDAEVLRAATAAGRAVLTLNRTDFIRLHARSREHAGIVVCTEDSDFGALAGRVDAALRAVGDRVGRLVRVTR